MSWKHAGGRRILMHFFWALPKAQPDWSMGASRMNLVRWHLHFGFWLVTLARAGRLWTRASSANTNAEESVMLLRISCYPDAGNSWVLPMVKQRWHDGSFSGTWHSVLYGRHYSRVQVLLLVKCTFPPFLLILPAREGNPPWQSFFSDYPSCQLSVFSLCSLTL